MARARSASGESVAAPAARRASSKPFKADALFGSYLVTLVGPGGIGKTRLALAVVQGLPGFRISVIDLATADDSQRGALGDEELSSDLAVGSGPRL